MNYVYLLERIALKAEIVLTKIDNISWVPSNIHNKICFNLFMDKPNFIRDNNKIIKCLLVAIECNDTLGIYLMIQQIIKNRFLLSILHIELIHLYTEFYNDKKAALNNVSIHTLLERVNDYISIL
jgi:hypothetical protein